MLTLNEAHFDRGFRAERQAAAIARLLELRLDGKGCLPDAPNDTDRLDGEAIRYAVQAIADLLETATTALYEAHV